MRHLTIAAAAMAVALTLGGCAGMTGADKAAALRYGLEHIEGCDRTYTGGTGVGGAFTFNIVCRARTESAPAAGVVADRDPPL